MGASTTKEARLKSELSQFAVKYGVIPLQWNYGNKFRISFGDFDFYGRGPTENLAKERALAKALKHLNGLPIPEKPEYAEFHELASKHGLTTLCAIDGNNAILKMGKFIVVGEGPTQRVALQKAVSEGLNYLRAYEKITVNEDYFQMTEEHRLTFLRSTICNAQIKVGHKSELSEFIEKYGVIPIQSVVGHKFKISFGDFDFYGRGPTDNLAKKRAVAKLLKRLNSLPIPDKPEYAEVHELASKHGLTTLCAVDGNNAKIKLGDFIFADNGPNQSVAVQKAVSKALRYLRACSNEQSTSSFEFFELREEFRLTFLTSIIGDNAEINLGDFIVKTQIQPTPASTGLLDTSPNVQMEKESTADSPTSSQCLSVQELGNEDDSKTLEETERQCISMSESSLAEDTIKEGKSPIGAIENQCASAPSTCDRSTQCLGPCLGDAISAKKNTSDANNSTEVKADESLLDEEPTTLEAIICVPVDQSITPEEIKEYLEPQIRALRQSPLHLDQTSDSIITAIIHVDNMNNIPAWIYKNGQCTDQPSPRVCAIMVRSRARFSKRIQLTPEEKKEILEKAVQDLTQEFLSPQLLKETALKPDAKLLNIFTEKMTEYFNILARQKLGELHC